LQPTQTQRASFKLFDSCTSRSLIMVVHASLWTAEANLKVSNAQLLKPMPLQTEGLLHVLN